MWRSTRLSADAMPYCSIQAAVHPAADRVAGSSPFENRADDKSLLDGASSYPRAGMNAG